MAIPDVSNNSIANLVSLEGRHAVVTGGARGLGKAIGRRLAEAGAAVLLADLNKAAAETSARELSETLQAKVLATTVDVTSGPSVAELAAAAVDRLGSIDIWVNNAGIFPTNPLLEMTDEDWDRVLDVNLRGFFIGAREAARCMIGARRPGVIVNIASVAGFRGIASGIGHYVASKYGVRGLTSQLAIELAPHDIRVLAVAPTTILTEGVLQAQPDQPLTSMLGRAGVPDDVARVVLFCASDMALFMTGSTVVVDAGRLSLG
jgi:NAD(P)-dependent dehydrogenase (short-subunit alcohol dehydrogenase family)